jgi:hypothetical protein
MLSLIFLAGLSVGVLATRLFYCKTQIKVAQDRRRNKPPRAWPIRDSRSRLIVHDRRIQPDRRILGNADSIPRDVKTKGQAARPAYQPAG